MTRVYSALVTVGFMVVIFLVNTGRYEQISWRWECEGDNSAGCDDILNIFGSVGQYVVDNRIHYKVAHIPTWYITDVLVKLNDVLGFGILELHVVLCQLYMIPIGAGFRLLGSTTLRHLYSIVAGFLLWFFFTGADAFKAMAYVAAMYPLVRMKRPWTVLYCQWDCCCWQ